MTSFYAVAKGRNGPQIFRQWNEAKRDVIGCHGAKFKKFDNHEDAQSFIDEHVTKKKETRIEPSDNMLPGHKLQECMPSQFSENDLVVFTDGSALNNGRKGARAGYGVYWPFEDAMLIGGYPLPRDDLQTNNRAEYTACIHALRQAGEIDPSYGKVLHIFTDSMLLIKSVTQWMSGWKKKGWKKSTGEEVLNKDLLEQLDDLLQTRKAIWRHVKAHTGKDDWISIQNDKVDRLAKEGAAS